MKNIKMKKISMLVGSSLLVLASTQSFAQNAQVKKEVSKVEVNKVLVPGVVTKIGSTPESFKTLKGFANELPLLTVMKQITPNGWIVKKNDSEENKLDVQKHVSWEGGKTWIETLEIISRDYNVNAIVNWEEKTITLSNAVKFVEKEKAPVKQSIFELEGTQKTKVTDVVVGASEQETKIEAIKPAVAEVQQGVMWEINVAKTLKENVQEWADKSGYRLVWTGEDYPVTTARILAGEFDAENGPVKQLSVDYGPDSRAQNPLSFQFYQNRTLVVENWMFEQTGYPQFNKKD